VFDPETALYGAELIEAVEHDDGSWFSVVSGPSTEAGADPCGEGQRAFGMMVFLLFGFAFERGRDGFEVGLVFGFEDVLQRSFGASVAILDHLHAGDAGLKGHRTEHPEGGGLHGHALDVEASGLDGAEQLLDHPAPAIELRDPARLLEGLDPVAGQQPPVRRRHPGRGVDLARLDKEDRLARRHAGRHGPALRALKRDRAEAHADAGRAFLLSGTGRQGDRMLPLRPVGQAGEQLARPLRDHPVLRGPDQNLHAFGPVGEHLVNVALTIDTRRHLRCAGRHQISAGPQAVDPALAFLVAKRAALRALALTAMTLNEPGIHKAQQRAMLALNRNRGMADKTVAQAVVAETRRVLDRQNMQTLNARRRAPDAARATLFSTVTLSFRRNRPIRTSPARLPPRRRTERPRGPCLTRRSCKNRPDRSTRRSPKSATALTMPQPSSQRP